MKRFVTGYNIVEKTNEFPDASLTFLHLHMRFCPQTWRQNDIKELDENVETGTVTLLV